MVLFCCQCKFILFKGQHQILTQLPKHFLFSLPAISQIFLPDKHPLNLTEVLITVLSKTGKTYMIRW